MLEKMMQSFKNFSGANNIAKFESFSEKRKIDLQSIREFYFHDIQKTIPELFLPVHSVSSPCLYRN